LPVSIVATICIVEFGSVLIIQLKWRCGLEYPQKDFDKKADVIRRLSALDDTQRMVLINKYAQQTEDIYCRFSAKDNRDIICKILLLKLNKDALVESYANGDPVVDYPGCRLDEFLNNEVAN